MHGQILAGHELHDERAESPRPRKARLVVRGGKLLESVHRRDVGTVQRRERLCLAPESCEPIRVRRERTGHPSLPAHLKLHHSFPTPDGSAAICVWEAESSTALPVLRRIIRCEDHQRGGVDFA